jgi:hypothetical protein
VGRKRTERQVFNKGYLIISASYGIQQRQRANTGPSHTTTPAPQTYQTYLTTAKRSKLDNGAVTVHPPYALHTRSVTPTPISAYYGASGRQILGSRNVLLNTTTPTPHYTHTKDSKMPSSTLPRLKSGLPVPQLVQTPSIPGVIPTPMQSRADIYGKLGFGLPSKVQVEPMRSSSNHSSATGSSATTTRVISQNHQRRESFRPRSSTGEKLFLSHRGMEERLRLNGTSEFVLEEEEI